MFTVGLVEGGRYEGVVKSRYWEFTVVLLFLLAIQAEKNYSDFYGTL